MAGTFVPPTLIELDSFDELKKEVFGPVLHVVRYNRNELDKLVEQINASGYGLTLGVHTRIDETIARSPAAPKWATCTSTAIWLARWSACSRSAAKVVRYRSESRRPAVSVPSALQPSAERRG
jgi:hypothetical protein